MAPPRRQASAAAPIPAQYGDIHVAAKMIRCSPKTVRRLISSGQPKAYRFGTKLLRVDLDELRALGKPVPTVDVDDPRRARQAGRGHSGRSSRSR